MKQKIPEFENWLDPILQVFFQWSHQALYRYNSRTLRIGLGVEKDIKHGIEVKKNADQTNFSIRKGFQRP